MSSPSALRRAVRGTLAAVSLLAFVALFLALQARIASWPVLGGLAAVAVGSLVAAGGRPAVRRLLGREPSPDGDGDRDGDDSDRDGDTDVDRDDSDADDRDRDADAERDDPDWWLARLEPALDDSWNRWSDAVLTVGLAALGIGSFALLVAHPGEDPPLQLLVTGLFGINGALITLAFALE